MAKMASESEEYWKSKICTECGVPLELGQLTRVSTGGGIRHLECPRHILVVDDDRDICEILKINLEEQGYHVDTAYSGTDGF